MTKAPRLLQSKLRFRNLYSLIIYNNRITFSTNQPQSQQSSIRKPMGNKKRTKRVLYKRSDLVMILKENLGNLKLCSYREILIV